MSAIQRITIMGTNKKDGHVQTKPSARDPHMKTQPHKTSSSSKPSLSKDEGQNLFDQLKKAVEDHDATSRRMRPILDKINKFKLHERWGCKSMGNFINKYYPKHYDTLMAQLRILKFENKVGVAPGTWKEWTYRNSKAQLVDDSKLIEVYNVAVANHDDQSGEPYPTDDEMDAALEQYLTEHPEAGRQKKSKSPSPTEAGEGEEQGLEHRMQEFLQLLNEFGDKLKSGELSDTMTEYIIRNVSYQKRMAIIHAIIEISIIKKENAGKIMRSIRYMAIDNKKRPLQPSTSSPN